MTKNFIWCKKNFDYDKERNFELREIIDNNKYFFCGLVIIIASAVLFKK